MASNPTYSVLPATLDITALKGDEFGMDLNFSVNLSNYTWEAFVFKTRRTVNSQYPGGLNTQGETAVTFTVNVVDAANGELNLHLDETDTNDLDEAIAYRWLLRGVAPGSVTRTYVSGAFTVQAP
tara:strand:+ start:1843 stop:2217 length:375 start_codon:yes stop_codon:yes gene_type:complete